MNLYSFFEVSETATYDEIRKAYYKKMLAVGNKIWIYLIHLGSSG
jgi:hypothetical protein